MLRQLNEISEGRRTAIDTLIRGLGYLREHSECWFTWNGDGREIADVLRRVGLAVKWIGTARMRIGVSLPKDELRMRAPTTADSPTERPADPNHVGPASPRECAAPRGAS